MIFLKKNLTIILAITSIDFAISTIYMSWEYHKLSVKAVEISIAYQTIYKWYSNPSIQRIVSNQIISEEFSKEDLKWRLRKSGIELP
jgi:hypothetical protein